MQTTDARGETISMHDKDTRMPAIRPHESSRQGGGGTIRQGQHHGTTQHTHTDMHTTQHTYTFTLSLSHTHLHRDTHTRSTRSDHHTGEEAVISTDHYARSRRHLDDSQLTTSACRPSTNQPTNLPAINDHTTTRTHTRQRSTALLAALLADCAPSICPLVPPIPSLCYARCPSLGRSVVR